MLGGVGVAAGQAHPPVGELRVGGPHLATVELPSAVDAPCRRAHRGEVRAGVGLGEQLAPQLLAAVGMAGSQRAFCSSVPWASSVGPARFTPMRPTSSGARARASSSCTTKFSAGPEVAAAVGGRPCHRHPARAGQVRLPPTAEGDLLAEVVEARGQTHPVLPWQVAAEPLPQLAAEVLLCRRRRQVHRPRQHDTRVRLRIEAVGRLRPVDFELSEDQVALRDAATSLLDDACSIDTGPARWPPPTAISTTTCGRPWPTRDGPPSSAPSEDGGLGLGLVEVAVLCEQLGRHLAPVPFAGTVVAHGALASAIASGDVDAARRRVGPG